MWDWQILSPLVMFTLMFFTGKNQYIIIDSKWISGNRASSDMLSESTVKCSSKKGCLFLLTHHFFIFHQNHVIGTECSTEYDASNSFKAVNPLFPLWSLSTHIKHPCRKNVDIIMLLMCRVQLDMNDNQTPSCFCSSRSRSTMYYLQLCRRYKRKHKGLNICVWEIPSYMKCWQRYKSTVTSYFSVSDTWIKSQMTGSRVDSLVRFEWQVFSQLFIALAQSFGWL